MRTHDVTRRGVIKLGLTSAALLAIPWDLRGTARAQGANPHFLVTFIADGGWDPTQTLDPHDPLDTTDGIDVDVVNPTPPATPLPPSTLATVGGITYCSNPATRPMVDTFFANWGSRSAVVNGINTRSTSHDQSRQLVLTGYLDATRADFAVMAAANNGADLPLPHLLISGESFGGPFAGLSGRVGGQLSQALQYNRIPGHTDPATQQQTASALGEAYIQQALEWERALDQPGAITGKLEQFRDAADRGDKLVRLAGSLPQNFNNGTQLATAVSNAFRSGMTASITLNVAGGFDTHNDNTQQNQRWNNLFTFLNDFVNGLNGQAGTVATTMLEETTMVYCSEFGRTPQLNGDNGKDHHPWTSMLFVGKNVRPSVTVGRTDRDQEGVKTNLSSGQPDDSGQVIDVTNMVAGILTLVGANPNQYLQNVKPFTGMINA